MIFGPPPPKKKKKTKQNKKQKNNNNNNNKTVWLALVQVFQNEEDSTWLVLSLSKALPDRASSWKKPSDKPLVDFKLCFANC